MDIHTIINRNFSKYLDVAFFFKFILLMGVLYFFNWFYIGITDPRGYIYSDFLVNSHCLDYVYWVRASILHTANLMAHGFGLHSYIANIETIRIYGGAGVIIGWPCLGLGLMSFWVAFSMAHDSRWKKKLIWSLVGTIAIWLINCLRIAVLLLALGGKWKVNKYMDHHTMFNWTVYLVIILMIYGYYRLGKKEVEGEHE